MMIRTLGAAGAVALALGVAPALANHEGGEPGARGQGAPGQVCRQQHDPTTDPAGFRECVRTLAQQRGHGQGNGNRGEARRQARAALAQAIATCRQQNQGNREAIRACIQTARQAARTARQQRRQALRQAIATCRQRNQGNRQAIRTCVQAAKAAARAGG
ncbi:MAG: hypothetical protein ICV64_08030 [Thermoleophilia bacterium]|nr:hypothetical protein [Thermoleophilia bacterium]